MFPNTQPNVETANIIGGVLGGEPMQHEVSLRMTDILSLALAMAIGVFVGMALFEGAKLLAN